MIVSNSKISCLCEHRLPSVTSRCNTLNKLKIEKTRAVIYLTVVLLISLGTTGSYNNIADAPAETSTPPDSTSDELEAPQKLMPRALAVSEEIQLRPESLPVVPASEIDDETLWLARCIYSETNRPEEQELIAWVVRNRVERSYRGKSSYRQVVLDPFQFSAFNADSPKSDMYRSLSVHQNMRGWTRALAIAYYVRHAPEQYRPFSDETLHFYSEQSMVGRIMPKWARGMTPVETPDRYKLDAKRFRFYEGIS